MRTYLYRITALFLLLSLAVSGVQAAGFNASVGYLSWSPDGSSLLYGTRKSGVFVVTQDDEPRHIADPEFYDGAPQWLPDGKSIIAAMQVDNQVGIFRISVKGDDVPQPLTEDAGGSPQVSPDGKWIAFLSLREGDENTSLYLMTIDGDDEHPLTKTVRVQDFAWSPDSKALVFMGGVDNDRGNTDLYRVGLDGEAATPLTTEHDVDDRYLPVWMPNSDLILFTALTDDNKGRIDLVAADGNNYRVFLEHAFEPVVSPDRQYIVYSSWGDQWFNLSIRYAGQTEPLTITLPGEGEYAYYSPAWSPDSSQFAFVAYHFGEPKSESIYVVGVDGLNPQVWVADPESY